MSDYSSTFPTQRPTLNLQFDKGSDELDSRLAYARSSTGTVSSSERHLSSENLHSYSNDLSQSVWVKSGATTPSIDNAAPDGNTTATALTENTGSAGHAIFKYFASVSGKNYTATTYAKSNGRTKFNFILAASGGSNGFATVEYDLTAVTSTVTGGAAVSHSIAAIGSTGWYKCVVTITSTGTLATAYHQINMLDASGAASYTGDGSSGLFLWGMQVSSLGEQTLNPTSGSIHREYSSTLTTSAADAPRFEFDPITGNAEGLLIESQASNLTVASEEVNNWTVDSATVQQNVAMSPAGTLTADRLVDNADGPRPHYVYKSTALGVSVGTTVYTVSFYAKASGHTELQSYDNNQNTSGNLTVNLANGTITSGTGAIKACGDGWHRISYQVTADHSTTSVVRILMKKGGSNSYLGDSYSGILLWGMQVEIGSAPTSYIKTTTSATASRAADSCSAALSDINFTGGEVTLVADSDTNATDDYRLVAQLIDDSQNQVSLYGNSYNNRLASILGGGESSILSQTSANGISALSFGVNDIAATRNGASPVTDTSQSFPDVSAGNLKIGGSGSTYTLNGHIKRLALYNVALSDTELQALTS